MQLIARAPDTGRSSSHLSSPRTARVAKAESSRGGGKTTGLSANHAATTTPCLALRFQTGSRTSGVDAHRVHALQGCECREKTHRLNCDPVDVMATVLSRRRPTCCWSKSAVAKEPRARRLEGTRYRHRCCTRDRSAGHPAHHPRAGGMGHVSHDSERKPGKAVLAPYSRRKVHDDIEPVEQVHLSDEVKQVSELLVRARELPTLPHIIGNATARRVSDGFRQIRTAARSRRRTQRPPASLPRCRAWLGRRRLARGVRMHREAEPAAVHLGDPQLSSVSLPATAAKTSPSPRGVARPTLGSGRGRASGDAGGWAARRRIRPKSARSTKRRRRVRPRAVCRSRRRAAGDSRSRPGPAIITRGPTVGSKAVSSRPPAVSGPRPGRGMPYVRVLLRSFLERKAVVTR